jgi:O-antigen/teichoic acid export membrane protein
VTSWRRGFVLLASGQAAGRLFAFVTTLALARALGAEPFGSVAFATAVLAYGTLIVDFGFDALGPVEIARPGVAAAPLVSTVMTVRLALSLVAAAALAAFAAAAPLTPATAGVVLTFGLSLPIAALDLRWALLGTGSLGAAAAAEALLQAVQMAGALALVRRPADLWRVPLIFLAAQASCVAATWIAWAARRGRPRLGIDRALARQLLPAALPLAGSGAVGMLLNNFDLVLIGLWLGAAAAGLYGAAYRVVWLPTVLVVAYAVALRPTVVRAEQTGAAAVALVLGRSHRMMAAVGMGAAVGGVLLARPLLEALYGADYAAAARPFQILVAALLLMLFSRPYRVLFVAARKQSWDFRILLAAAAVNVAAAVVLLPRLGLAGAAWATLASEAVFLAAAHAAARRLAPGLGLVHHLVRPALCAAAMAGVLLALAGRPLPLRVGAGALCYLAFALALRILDAREVRGLMESGLPAPAP